MKNTEREYLKLLYDNGYCNLRECNEKENEEFSKLVEDELPVNILRNEIDNNHCCIEKQELTDEQLKIQISLKQSLLLKTIKNCLLYFVILSAISILGSIIIYAIMANQF